MLRKLVSIVGVTAAAFGPLALTAPAQAAQLNRCEVTLADSHAASCGYVATTTNGLGTYVVLQGRVHLTINCTFGGTVIDRDISGSGTVTYNGYGTCGAALTSGEVPGIATANVGSTGIPV